MTVSFGRARVSRSASTSSTRSPDPWPKVSLTSLKRSMSRYSSATTWPLRSERAIVCCSKWWNCIRFGIFVSASYLAR